jgi:hypothetical protein
VFKTWPFWFTKVGLKGGDELVLNQFFIATLDPLTPNQQDSRILFFREKGQLLGKFFAIFIDESLTKQSLVKQSPNK